MDCLPPAQRKRLQAAAEAATKADAETEQFSPEREAHRKALFANRDAAQAEAERSGLPFHMKCLIETIDAVPLQATVASVPSFEDPTKLAITRELARVSGLHYYEGLAKLDKITDGATFLVEGSDETAFDKVIFIGNDGGLSVPEYVVAALTFAEKCGLESVGLPGLSFLKVDELTNDGRIADPNVWAQLYDAIRTGVYTFLQIPGRKSLQFVMITMPDIVRDEVAGQNEKN
jgi:hypothetical protein